jgi:hypothetical protein
VRPVPLPNENATLAQNLYPVPSLPPSPSIPSLSKVSILKMMGGLGHCPTWEYKFDKKIFVFLSLYLSTRLPPWPHIFWLLLLVPGMRKFCLRSGRPWIKLIQLSPSCPQTRTQIVEDCSSYGSFCRLIEVRESPNIMHSIPHASFAHASHSLCLLLIYQYLFLRTILYGHLLHFH